MDDCFFKDLGNNSSYKRRNQIRYMKFIVTILIVMNVTYLSGESKSQKERVLAGLILRTGDIVDSIRPIYANVNKTGKLDDLSFGGEQVGGKGGSERIVLKNGYVIVGFILDKGNYFGASHIARLRVVWQKWNRNKPEGDLILSDSFSSGNNLMDAVKLELIAPSASYIYELSATATEHTNGDNFLSDIQISTINENKLRKNLNTSPIFLTPITYEIDIEIISGFNRGKKATGFFTYNTSNIKGEGEEFIEVSDIEFIYDKDAYTRDMFDSVPKVRLLNGEFKELQLVGGPQTKRFGINSGFNRNQFGRDSEKFILNGEDYFGYLNADTYVEGAGKVKYTKQIASEQSR